MYTFLTHLPCTQSKLLYIIITVNRLTFKIFIDICFSSDLKIYLISLLYDHDEYDCSSNDNFMFNSCLILIPLQIKNIQYGGTYIIIKNITITFYICFIYDYNLYTIL